MLCARICSLSKAVIAAHKAISGGFRKLPTDCSEVQELKNELEASPELVDRVEELRQYVMNSHIVDSAADRRNSELDEVCNIASQLHLNRFCFERWCYSGRDAEILKSLLRRIEDANERFQVSIQLLIRTNVRSLEH